MTRTHRGLTNRSIVGVFWTGLSFGAEGALQLIALVLLARMLVPDEFGLFSAAMVVVGFSSIFTSLGVGPAIVQRPDLEDRHLRVGFTLSVLMSFAVAGSIWTAAPAIAAFFRMPDLLPIVQGSSFVFLCQGFAIVAQALSQRELRFGWLATVDAWSVAAGFVVAAPFLAWLGYGVWALIGAVLIQSVLRTILLLTGQPHPKRPQLDARTVRELLYFGGGFTVARTANYVAGQVDKFVVGRWLGAESLGLYALTHQLMSAPANLFGQVLDRVLFPTMALVQLDRARLARAYGTSVAVCALLVLPISLLVAILAPEVVRVLLGPQWSDAVVPLQIFLIGMLFRTSYKLSDTVARATGSVYARAWRQGAYALAVFSFALIGQRWGLQGVALGVVAAIAFNFFLMAQLSLRLIGMRWETFAAAHVPGFMLAVALGLESWLLAAWLRGHEVAPVLLLIVIGVAAAITALLLCWRFPRAFLGPDARPLVRALAAFAPVSIQPRIQWMMERYADGPKSDDPVVDLGLGGGTNDAAAAIIPVERFASGQHPVRAPERR